LKGNLILARVDGIFKDHEGSLLISSLMFLNEKTNNQVEVEALVLWIVEVLMVFFLDADSYYLNEWENPNPNVVYV